MQYRFTNSLPYLLNRADVRIGDLFSQRLAEYDLTLPMYRAMAVLRQEGPQRLSDLSAMITVEISTVSRLVTTLKRRGLLSRERLEDNGRTVRIDLTEAGRQLVEELMPIAADFEAIGTGTFSDSEIAWLKKALRQIYGNFAHMEKSSRVQSGVGDFADVEGSDNQL
ncbi:MarR family transcriptional regulator [Mesorhizobium sp.]|uniref:MarR family winged helix-turn-helix transcriptional regulator n=1 Tax=Mesorhizobium sp. TaxID=1871066 RepID=UPI000FE8D5C0|nr:MarR family transcriptional regulator [Mesorhizobium sp.]RWP66362.1 MAG: MarR family transcriptional regulator [Mesorhizobium sp.]